MNLKLRTITYLAIFMIAAGCSQKEQEQAAPVVRPIKMLAVNIEGISRVLEFPGKVSPAQEVTMAFEVTGKITELPVTEGQAVSKGDLLCQLDPRDYQSALNSAQAQYNTNKADFDRAQNLVKSGALSVREKEIAQAKFETAEANLDTAQKRLDDTRLIAPFDGIVAKKLVDNFQNIQPKQAILILQDNSSLEIKVNVPERDLAQRKKGGPKPDPQVIISSFPDRQFPAHFKEVSTTADPVTRTFELTLAFDTPEDIRVLPGMTAKVTIRVPAKADNTGATLIPAHAVLADDDGNSTVWVINPNTMLAERRIIEVGSLSGDSIMLLSGLEQGELIAISGVHQLSEGQKVRSY